MRVGIAYSSKDRVEKTKRTLKPLLHSKQWDTWWFDGSQTQDGQAYHEKNCHLVKAAVVLTGGSCRYIVCALTTLLEYGREEGSGYDYIGLVENDVLLDDDWFARTMPLFAKGEGEGFKVGAVSARTYVDRILIQHDGYAVMHNLGAGMVIFTREAAEIVLQYYRTGMTVENRKVFAMLAGVDFGKYWAFGGSEHMLVADWQWDRMLAQHGLCSLALTPTKAKQLEDIKAQGLMLAKKPVKELQNLKCLARYQRNLEMIRKGEKEFPRTPGLRLFYGDTWTIFPHQIPGMGGGYSGHWKFKWSLGYGCFSWKSGEEVNTEARTDPITWDTPPTVSIPAVGPVEILVAADGKGSQVLVEDDNSGFSCSPEIQPSGGALSIAVPGSVAYRTVKVTALKPDLVFYGIRTREPQPYLPHIKFNFNMLPPP